ncbi:hypothetical protein POTOM_055846 [Populus tomentosa]|uniref:Uncharacterized protein n=1 Tax=Populus tomentosa TaxID=118781 RepID=A0A8X7XZY2_POPTO|nr:hypothetical protein POTOM_055846 [Populus tomentosa]
MLTASFENVPIPVIPIYREKDILYRVVKLPLNNWKQGISLISGLQTDTIIAKLFLTGFPTYLEPAHSAPRRDSFTFCSAVNWFLIARGYGRKVYLHCMAKGSK